MRLKNDDPKQTIETFDEPLTDKHKVIKLSLRGGPQTESIKVVKFLERMEVNTSATLESKHHANKIRRTLTSVKRSKNPIYGNVKEMDFAVGMGIDGEYHVWRDA